MKKVLLVAFLSFSLVSVFFGAGFAQAQEPLEVHFFYSETCPHCIEEQGFLDDYEEMFPEVPVNRYVISDTSHHDLLTDLVEKHGAEEYLGLVPLTFIGEDFFLGFDNEKTTGAEIIASTQKQLGLTVTAIPESSGADNTVTLPFIGEIDLTAYSLPVLAVVLGTLDGFNVCSLGALVLILGLVMTLKSRKKIATYGGIFLITTAVVYGFLIFLWHQLFVALSGYIQIFEFIIASLGIIGGLYFLRQFYYYRKFGPTCDSGSNSFITRATKKIQASFDNPSSMWALAGAVFLFSFIVVVVEFPCSAAVPVAFAGVLADTVSSPITSIFYIGLFIIFYLLDEIIIFAIAVSRMEVWFSSPKATVWITLAEGLILLALGIFYLL